jgi:predicted aspartyl protease
MAHYDTQVHPPAGFTEIRITNPDNGRTTTRRAKLDTGASMTVLPRDVVTSLELVSSGRIIASGFDRIPIERPTYFAHLQLEGFAFSNVKVTVAPREDVLLGRDVLNHFIATFDAKSLTVEMRDP